MVPPVRIEYIETSKGGAEIEGIKSSKRTAAAVAAAAAVRHNVDLQTAPNPTINMYLVREKTITINTTAGPLWYVHQVFTAAVVSCVVTCRRAREKNENQALAKKRRVVNLHWHAWCSESVICRAVPLLQAAGQRAKQNYRSCLLYTSPSPRD